MSEETPSREDKEHPDGGDKTVAGPIDVRSIMLSGLFVLAVCYTLHFAKPILMPLALALLLAMVLRPAVGLLHRWRIPWGLSAGIVLVTLLGILAGAITTFAQPATEWLETLPSQLREAERELRELKKPIEEVAEATERVEEMTKMPGGGEQVTVRSTTFIDSLLSQTGGAVTIGLLTVVFLYFMLASGDLFLRKLVHVVPKFRNKVRAIEIVHRIRTDVSTYLLTITLINIALGILVGLAMWLVGMPDPALWGVLAGLLNFIPYLGSFAGILLATMVALVSFDNIGSILLVPASYYALTAVEGNFITPTVLGKRLTLNPFIVFVGLIFWGWIWGLIGAFLAVPILAVMKIIFDRIESTQPLGEFMGG